MPRTGLASLVVALALVGCNEFGDVDPPPEGSGGSASATGASASGPAATGANTTGAQATGAGATGATSAGTNGTVGAGPGCVFAGDPACSDCVQTKCCASLAPANQIEAGPTVTLGTCLEAASGCACSNGLNVCFSQYEMAVAPTSADAFALSGCIRGACDIECDCCSGH